jgi:AcrR family transcriptional regulator
MTAAILDAARSVMREQGVAALSLREVARRVRMQPPSLYEYFPNKDALYDALFLQAIRVYRTYRDQPLAAGASFWDKVTRIFEDYMRFAHENQELYRLAYERPVPGFVPSDASMAESLQLLSRLEQTAADAIANGEVRSDLTMTQVRDIVIALAHGLTSQHMANEPHLPVGSGRYGGLVPTAVEMLRAAWSPVTTPEQEEHRAVDAGQPQREEADGREAPADTAGHHGDAPLIRPADTSTGG